ncbi:prepilin-type N-terminal cleavage/methylation domain-containing protein [Oceanithermus sp.]
MKKRRGMTLLEVMIAIAILAIALGALATILSNNIRFNASSGERTQAVQILNYLGRQIVGGNGSLMPPEGKQYSWDYGQLGSAFPELDQGGNISDPAKYRAVIYNQGQPSSLAAINVSLDQYKIEVCWRTGNKDVCVQAYTLSSQPPGGGTAPPLPGIN